MQGIIDSTAGLNKLQACGWCLISSILMSIKLLNKIFLRTELPVEYVHCIKSHLGKQLRWFIDWKTCLCKFKCFPLIMSVKWCNIKYIPGRPGYITLQNQTLYLKSSQTPTCYICSAAATKCIYLHGAVLSDLPGVTYKIWLLLLMTGSCCRWQSRLRAKDDKRKWHFYLFCDFGINRRKVFFCIIQQNALTKFAFSKSYLQFFL